VESSALGPSCGLSTGWLRPPTPDVTGVMATFFWSFLALSTAQDEWFCDSLQYAYFNHDTCCSIAVSQVSHRWTCSASCRHTTAYGRSCPWCNCVCLAYCMSWVYQRVFCWTVFWLVTIMTVLICAQEDIRRPSHTTNRDRRSPVFNRFT